MKYTFIYKIYCGEMTPRVGRVEIKTAQTYTDAKNDFERLIEIENNDIINEEELRYDI